MPVLKLRIGATMDASLADIVFAPLVDSAQRARELVKRQLDGIEGDLKRLGTKAGKSGNHYRVNAPGGDDGGQERLNRKRRVYREEESEEDRHNREMARKQREAARLAEAEQKRQGWARERSIGRMAGDVGRNFGGVVRRGASVGADIARGAGVDFSLGNAVQGRFDLEKRAIDLSNAGFMPGEKGPLGQRQDPRSIMREAQEVANATALDPNRAIEGLQAFVGKTGDLATGRAVLKDMAVLARATGGELEDIVSAAGDVAANLGEVGKQFKTPEEKARAVASVMHALAAQGKVGAVEMKDLASQMAKLAASAPQFTGSVERNMEAMGALAQMARAKGGAASATQATTSVQGFVNTFDKEARRKEFEKAGVKIRDAANMLLDPEEIIVNSLKTTKGDPGKMNKLFMDAGAKRVTRGFQNIYNQAEQEKKGSGEAAVRAEFAKLRGASMGTAEREGSFAASMQGREAQTQILKNQIQQSLGDAVEKVAPEMMALAPRVGQATEALGSFVGWAASHPWKAAFAGVGLAVGKAVAEEASRAVAKVALETAGKAVTGQLSALGNAGLAITAAAVTLIALNEVKTQDEQKKKTATESTEEMLATAGKITGQIGLERAKEQAAQMVIDEEVARPEGKRDTARLAQAEADKKRAQQRQAELREQAADIKGQLEGDIETTTDVEQKRQAGGATFGMNTFLKSFGFNVDAPGRRDIATAEATAAKMDEVKAAVDALKATMSAGIPVTVKNLPAGGDPVVNPAGRTGTGG